MKKLKVVLALTLLAVAGVNVSAKAGIEAGYINMRYTMSGGDMVLSNPSLNGFYVGVSDDIRIVAGLGIHIGLNYAYATDKTARSLLEDMNATGGLEKDHYLNVPLRLRYNFNIVPRVLKIQAFAGPVFSFGLSHTQESGFDSSEGYIKYNYYSGKLKSDVFDGDEMEGFGADLPVYKRFDMALGGGVGIELLNLIEVKLGYDWGLSNRFKGDLAETMACKRNMFYVTLGLRF